MRSFRPILIKGLSVFFFSAAILAATEKKEGLSTLEWRKNALLQLDEWLDTLTPSSLKRFPLIGSSPSYKYENPPTELSSFALEHGFFSATAPLIGKVTDATTDVAIVQKALTCIAKSKSPFFVELATAEVLSKALAYRNLQKGMKIQIPVATKKGGTLVTYVVDEVIDLWQEMPAFGLLSENKKHFPILLFRGTDLSLASKKSWASLLSDLDVSGTGFSTFHFAKADIHAWLEKAFAQSKKKTKTMGFSLGGILALYTTLFESDWIDAEGCIAFNPPGVSSSIARKWLKSHLPHKIYITQGDVIPKLGIQPSPAFALFGAGSLSPIKAHTQLMTAEPTLFLEKIALPTLHELN